MPRHIKVFDTHAQYIAFKQTQDFVLPNISLCENMGNEVHFNAVPEPQETRIVAKLNVTDTTNATKLMDSSATSQFSAIEIDGVEQQSVVDSYTFSTTGSHIVKYTLATATTIGVEAFSECSNLRSIIIPEGVTTISDGAFYECSGLRYVTLPSSITTIGNYVFCHCSLLSAESRSVISAINPNSLNCGGMPAG